MTKTVAPIRLNDQQWSTLAAMQKFQEARQDVTHGMGIHLASLRVLARHKLVWIYTHQEIPHAVTGEPVAVWAARIVPFGQRALDLKAERHADA